jgi:uncharacterized ion transporter superfamily protein YfcC
VKVTEVPAHTGFADATIDTLTANIGLTVIVIALDVAGLPVGQGVIFEVITHVTTFPFARAAFVYVELFIPTLIPFNFH